MEKFFRFRWLVGLAIVAMTAAALIGITRIEFNDRLSDMFKADNADYRQMVQFFDEFGADDTSCVVVFETDDFFRPPPIAVMRQVAERAAAIPAVRDVRSMLDVRRPAPVLFRRVMIPVVPADDAPPERFEAARQLAIQHPLIAGQLLSPDGRMALMVIRLEGAQPPIEAMRPVVKQLEDLIVAATAGTGVRARLTGVPPLRVELYDVVRGEQIFFTLAGAGIVIVIATVLFRRLLAVLIVGVAPLLGMLWTMGAMGFFGEPINTLNNILPALVLIVGFTDSVHLMVDVRRQRALGLPPRSAAATALRHLFLPCAMTSLTTSVGFGSLVLAEIEVIQRFGLACAAGAIFNFLAVVTVVPLLSSTPLGRYVSSPQRRPTTEAFWFGVFRRASHWITHHAKTVTAAGILITAVLVYGGLQLTPDNSIAESMPSSSESYQALKAVEAHFGGALYSYAVVTWPATDDLSSPRVLQALADVHQVLDEPPALGTPFSVLNVLASLPRRGKNLSAGVAYLELGPPDLIEQLVRPDLRKAVVSIHTPDVGTREFAPIMNRLDAALERLQRDKYPDFEIRLTGSMIAASRNVNLMILDLCKSLSVAAFVIFCVIALAFRSIRFGLISILPNSLPLAAAASFQWLLDGSLHLASVMMFSICLGVAVDDTIHFISRFYLERTQSTDILTIVENSVAKVGAALLVTTVALVGGFGIGMFSQLPAMRNFAILACVGLIAALVADVLLLPALLVCFAGRARRRPAPDSAKGKRRRRIKS